MEPTTGPQHWRERAREARAASEFMIDAYSKRIMLEIAERYEAIAKRAEIKGGPTSAGKE